MDEPAVSVASQRGELAIPENSRPVDQHHVNVQGSPAFEMLVA
jgi:hypothetical protein